MENKKINIFVVLILCVFILLTQGGVINEKTINAKKHTEPYFNAILNDNIKNQVNINDFFKEPKNAKERMYSSSENYDDLTIAIGSDSNRSVGIIGIGTKNLDKLKSAINPKLFAEIEKNIKKNPYSVGDASYSYGTTTIEGLKIDYDEDLLFYKSDYRSSFEFFLQLEDKRISYLFFLINMIFIFLVCFVLYIKTKEDKKFIIYISLGILWAIIAFMIGMAAGLGALGRGYPGGSPSFGLGQILLFPTYASYLIYTPIFGFFLFLINPLIIGAIIPVLIVMMIHKRKK